MGVFFCSLALRERFNIVAAEAKPFLNDLAGIPGKGPFDDVTGFLLEHPQAHLGRARTGWPGLAWPDLTWLWGNS
jgi:hypothetical protein